MIILNEKLQLVRVVHRHLNICEVTIHISGLGRSKCCRAPSDAFFVKLTLLCITFFGTFCNLCSICDVFSNLISTSREIMELTHANFSAILFHNFRRGFSLQDCIDPFSLYTVTSPTAL